MAGISKVVYGNAALIDLTSDTVAADRLTSGTTAHTRSGDSVTGAIKVWTKMARDSNGDTRPYWVVEG